MTPTMTRKKATFWSKLVERAEEDAVAARGSRTTCAGGVATGSALDGDVLGSAGCVTSKLSPGTLGSAEP